ncbi:hypothetical protein ACFSHQ_20915 [Gemmobacter lanyuensis]
MDLKVTITEGQALLPIMTARPMFPEGGWPMNSASRFVKSHKNNFRLQISRDAGILQGMVGPSARSRVTTPKRSVRVRFLRVPMSSPRSPQQIALFEALFQLRADLVLAGEFGDLIDIWDLPVSVVEGPKHYVLETRRDIWRYQAAMHMGLRTRM